MKKIYFLTLALICAFVANAVSITGGTKLYLQPNSNWVKDSARFAIYVFGNGDNWASMSLVEGETNIYEATVPEGTWTNVIFTRMNPGTTANNWDNKWNQTGDLTYDGTNNLYILPEDGNAWDYAAGTWSTYGNVEVDPTLSDYYIMGNEINGWTADAGYQFKKTDVENVFTIEGVKLCGFFKVGTRDWSTSLGVADANQLAAIGEAVTLVNDGASKNLYLDNTYIANVTLDMTGTAPTITVTGEATASGVYLKGTMNDWSENADFQFTSIGGGMYVLDKEIYASTGAFKITANNKWYGLADETENENATISYNIATALSDAKNIALPAETVAKKFTFVIGEDGSTTLTVEQGAIVEGIFLRGTMNNWESLDEYKFTETATEGIYELNNIRLYGQFKIADAIWGTYNIGSSDNSKIKVGEVNYLVNGGESVNMAVNATYQCSTITLDLTGDSPALTIIGEEVGSGIFLTGDMNEWATDNTEWEFLDNGACYYTIEQEFQDTEFKVLINGVAYGVAEGTEFVYDELLTLVEGGENIVLPEETAACMAELTYNSPSDVTLYVSEGSWIEPEDPTDPEDPGASAITEIEAGNNTAAEYYNLQGVKIAKPEKGVYIMRQGSKTAKVVF